MAAKEGNISPPNWSATPKFTSPAPSTNDAGKIPPKTEPKPFAGLPGSSAPRPLKMEGH